MNEGPTFNYFLGGTGILAGPFHVRDRLEACPTLKTEGLSP